MARTTSIGLNWCACSFSGSTYTMIWRVLSAVGRRNRRAGNAGDLIANLKLQVVVQLSFVQPFATHGQQAHRQARCIHFHDYGRQRTLRQPPHVGHGEIGNLRHIRVGVGSGLKVNLDQTHAGHRTRFHVIHAAGQREKSFERVGNVRFDLLRRHAAVKRGHQHDGNIDGGKHVHGHARQAGQPEHARRTGRKR